MEWWMRKGRPPPPARWTGRRTNEYPGKERGVEEEEVSFVSCMAAMRMECEVRLMSVRVRLMSVRVSVSAHVCVLVKLMEN